MAAEILSYCLSIIKKESIVYILKKIDMVYIAFLMVFSCMWENCADLCRQRCMQSIKSISLVFGSPPSRSSFGFTATCQSVHCLCVTSLSENSRFFSHVFRGLKVAKKWNQHSFGKIPVKIPIFLKINCPSLNGCCFACISMPKYVQIHEGVNRRPNWFSGLRNTPAESESLGYLQQFHWIRIAFFCISFKQGKREIEITILDGHGYVRKAVTKYGKNCQKYPSIFSLSVHRVQLGFRIAEICLY